MPNSKHYPVWLSRFFQKVGFRRDWFLIPLAAVVGALAGVVALGFGKVVEGSERFFFSTLAPHESHVSRTWLLLVLPAVGGLLVGVIKWTFRLPMVTHGIPEVMESLARHQGHIPKRAGVFAFINPALTIGSGGSAGQEGPIIHIGSALGSWVGRVLRLDRDKVNMLVGCGAAGGLAAIFNAPITGVLLVLEVMLRDFSIKTFTPIVVSAVFAVAVFQGFAGANESLFNLQHELIEYQFSIVQIVPYIGLGVVCGLVGWLFTRCLYWLEHVWAHVRVPMVLKPMCGGLVLGVMGFGMVLAYGSVVPGYDPPSFFANGYPVVEMLMRPDSFRGDVTGALGGVTLGFLLLTAAGKTIGTGMTLGSGGAGGIFAPSLVIGSTTGAALGVILNKVGVTDVSPAAFALAGMAGVLSGAVHCPLTAFILVFEVTRDYSVILPVMLVSITSTVVAQLLMSESIYTLALRQMGLRVNTASDIAVLRHLTTSQVELSEATVAMPGDPARRLFELIEQKPNANVAVCNADGSYVGLITDEDIRLMLLEPDAAVLLIAAELVRYDLPTVKPDEPLDSVLDKFSVYDVSSLPVISQDESRKLLGMITRNRLMMTYHQATDRPHGTQMLIDTLTFPRRSD